MGSGTHTLSCGNHLYPVGIGLFSPSLPFLWTQALCGIAIQPSVSFLGICQCACISASVSSPSEIIKYFYSQDVNSQLQSGPWAGDSVRQRIWPRMLRAFEWCEGDRGRGGLPEWEGDRGHLKVQEDSPRVGAGCPYKQLQEHIKSF